jgi:uncharacterized protein YcbX
MYVISAFWRYPAKSMQGEELNGSEITERGLLGDRGYALVDAVDGRVGTARYPRKWPRLLEFRATYTGPARLGEPLPSVQIALPDGMIVHSDDPEVDQRLSAAIGHAVRLASTPPPSPTTEAYWPDVEGVPPLGEPVPDDHGETITSLPVGMASPPGTFFDYTPIHLMTTATLDRLRELNPTSRFEIRRFRTNLVVTPEPGLTGFVENDWVGRTIFIGDEVRLRVLDPCPRCVVTTLPQGDLPQDMRILRTAAQHNTVPSGTLAPGMPLKACVGVYASVFQGE